MKRDARRAFTLIELLIVIAIISLLLAVVMPALARSRATGQSSVCLSNLRRLAVGNQLYVQVYDVFPPFRLKTDPSGATYVNRYGRAKPRWQWFIDHGIGAVIEPTGFTAPFGDKSMSTAGGDGLTMTNRYFVDPSLGEARWQFNIRNGAYGYNYQYLGNTRTDTTPGEYDNWPVTATRISTPSQTVLFADSRGGAVEHGAHSYALDPPKLARSQNSAHFGPNGSTADEQLGHSPVEARHLGRGNVAFVDTHAEMMTLTKLGYELDGRGRPIPDGAAGSNALWSGTGRDEAP